MDKTGVVGKGVGGGGGGGLRCCDFTHIYIDMSLEKMEWIKIEKGRGIGVR